MGRSRGRERGRIVDGLRADFRAMADDRASDRQPTDWFGDKPSQPTTEEARVGLLNVQDLGAFVEFRTAGRPGSRDPQHRTAARLVGIRDSTQDDHRVLVIQQGNEQRSLTIAVGEPITIRRVTP